MSDHVLNGTDILIFSDRLQPVRVYSTSCFGDPFPVSNVFSRGNVFCHNWVVFFPHPSSSRTSSTLTLFAARLLVASCVLRLIEYFDQKPCLIYIEMIPLLVEKIRINWFPWDSRWKAFEAVQSREREMSPKIALKVSWKRLI